MNAFSPFIAEWQTNDRLLLKLTTTRKRLHFIFIFAVPFILVLCLLVLVKILPGAGLPPWFYNLYCLVLVLGIAVSLWVKMVAEVQLSKTEINQVYFRMFQTRQASFAVNDVLHIEVVTNHGRSAGFYYYLKMKDGRRILLLNVPKWLLKTPQKNEMNDALQKATGLEVKSS